MINSCVFNIIIFYFKEIEQNLLLMDKNRNIDKKDRLSQSNILEILVITFVVFTMVFLVSKILFF